MARTKTDLKTQLANGNTLICMRTAATNRDGCNFEQYITVHRRYKIHKQGQNKPIYTRGQCEGIIEALEISCIFKWPDGQKNSVESLIHHRTLNTSTKYIMRGKGMQSIEVKAMRISSYISLYSWFSFQGTRGGSSSSLFKLWIKGTVVSLRSAMYLTLMPTK